VSDWVINKRKVFLVIGVLAVLFVLFMASAIYVAERPAFCNTCHNMKPYYKGWQESPHKDVSCLDCHYEPTLGAHLKGKIDGLMQVIEYITGRYSDKPVAKINDTSCLREGCHDKQDLKNTAVMFKDKVSFTHKTHWRDFDELGKGVHLRCTTCHMWLTFDKHIDVDENTCLVCHFKNVSVEKITHQCLTCHTEISQNDEHKEYVEEGMHCADCHTTIKTTNAPVLEQMCYFCHADPEKLAKIGDRDLMHQSHVTKNNADCINCHEFIKHGKE